MKDIVIDIKSAAFPSQLASDAQKASDDFGLQVGQAIQYEWFRKDGNSCRYYGQWRDFHRLRLYARGEQPIAKYKNELAIDGDLSYLNLDWTPVPILPKFVDIVVNGMCDVVLVTVETSSNILCAFFAVFRSKDQFRFPIDFSDFRIYSNI